MTKPIQGLAEQKTEIERLLAEKADLQGQVKRAYEKLNLLTIRNSYLEWKLQESLENESQAVVEEEEEDDDDEIVVAPRWG